MIRPRWRKVMRDLWGNKVRSLLVILSIAIGVFAVGMIKGTQILLQEDLALAYDATHPANAILFADKFDQEFLHAVRRMDGVTEADARTDFSIPVQIGPDEWIEMQVIILTDYNDQSLHIIAPLSGAWPPPEHGLLVERASLSYLQAEIGETVTVETPNGRMRQLSLDGLVHDIFTNPVQFTGEPYVYATVDTLEWLGYSRAFDELYISVEGDTTDEAHVEEIAAQVANKIEKSGRTVYWTDIAVPAKHPASEAVDPLLAILGALGVLSLLASGFLVVNIINGLLAQHTTQIGIMKAIGARKSHLVQMYLVLVILFGLLSLVISIPLGGLAAYGFTSYLASLINFSLNGFRIPYQVIIIQVAVAILAPVLSALIPVFKGSGITVREALSEQGLGKGQFGATLLDRIVNWLTSVVLTLSRPLRISLRNTIRRKARLALTLVTLTLGGAIFIGVLSVHASLLQTLDDALAYFNYDVEIDFSKAHRIEEIQREAMQVPGVAFAEGWIGNAARRVDAEGKEGESFYLFGTESDTVAIEPILLEGRWLLPDDENAIVLNSLVLKEEPDIKVGDTITLKIGGRESDWQVVGLVQGVLTGGIGYANQPYLERELRVVGKSSSLKIIGTEHDAAAQADLLRRLEDHFENLGMDVGSSSKTADIRENIEYQFNIIVTLLAVMAILVAFVGGLGLMGTMSINVLERTREIGVMRAIGASDGSILRIILVEGVLIGIISWFIGSLLAYPIGKMLSDIVGTQLLESPLNYVFALNGALGWLLAIIFIGFFASFLPAWNASRLSVRETLAYE